jgi:hypothetical protein
VTITLTQRSRRRWAVSLLLPDFKRKRLEFLGEVWQALERADYGKTKLLILLVAGGRLELPTLGL